MDGEWTESGQKVDGAWTESGRKVDGMDGEWTEIIRGTLEAGRRFDGEGT